MAITGFALFASSAFAQFTGQVSMNLYNVDDGEITETNELNLYATENRILIKGEDKINISDGMMEAEGLLIRADMKDFVVMMGDNQALRFTKEELEGMFSMFSMLAGDDEDMKVETDADYKYTNEVRTVNGMKATELQVWSKNEEGYLSIWLTNEIDINWGMLEQPWNNVPGGFKNTSAQITQEFKSRNFPVLIEAHDPDNDYKIFEVTKVKKSRIAKDMVEVPSNLEMMSLQTMIMKAMMNR